MVKFPSFKILALLCQRLDIEVGDIVINQHQTKAWRNLSQAENAYLRFDYSEIHSLLKELQPSDLRLPYDRVHYNYLNGIYALENEQDQVKALAYFQEIIDEDWLAPDNLYYLLALKGFAEVYEARREYDTAKKYYDLLAKPVTDLKIKDNLAAIQIMSILYRTGEFYGRHNYMKDSNHLLHYAYKIGSRFHEVYYMGRILYRLGLNANAKGS